MFDFFCKLKSWFCKHKYVVDYATFPLKFTIDEQISNGLSYKARHGYTNFDLFHYSCFCTYYRYDKEHVYLFRKKCTKCGKVQACNAYDAQKFLNNEETFTQLLKELNDVTS